LQYLRVSLQRRLLKNQKKGKYYQQWHLRIIASTNLIIVILTTPIFKDAMELGVNHAFALTAKEEGMAIDPMFMEMPIFAVESKMVLFGQ
jgi:hypothetical protein